MAELIIHGVPDGQQISKCDKKLQNIMGLFYDNSVGIKTDVRRYGNDVFYSYLIYEDQGKGFADFNGRAGSYFGMTLVLHGQYIPDSARVFKLLQTTYDNYVKNKIIKEFPNGSHRWLYPEISTPDDAIAVYICKAMAKTAQDNPELYLKSQQLPPVQNQSQRN